MSGSDLVDRSRTYSVPLIHSVVSAAVEYLYCRPTDRPPPATQQDLSNHQVRARWLCLPGADIIDVGQEGRSIGPSHP